MSVLTSETTIDTRAATLAPEVIRRTREIAGIPAPTGDEGDRARLIADWWRADDVARISVDEVGNVWGLAHPGDGLHDEALVLCAHMDTVFDRGVDHEPRVDGTRLIGPGVGDDSVALAALSGVATLLASVGGTSRPLWLLATVAEEGLGNLAGIRHALTRLPSRVAAIVAIEGNYLGRISHVGVGSIRWQVSLEGLGGHSWEASEAPSAVHVVGRLIVALDEIQTRPGCTSLNVGTLTAGEAVNARGRHARFALDLRAADPDALDSLAQQAKDVLESATGLGMTLTIDELGRRPAGRTEADHVLVRAAQVGLARIGTEARLVATSTDANAAMAAGIPAVALGITEGLGEHTLAEWIDLDKIPRGLAALAYTLLAYENAAALENAPRTEETP